MDVEAFGSSLTVLHYGDCILVCCKVSKPGKVTDKLLSTILMNEKIIYLKQSYVNRIAFKGDIG